MNELRQKRKELGLTQVEAAKICGVSRRSFQYYEENPEYEEMRKKVLDIITRAQKNHILGQQFIKFNCAQIFKNYPEVRCAYLYGSYARKEATSESDVDILVVCPPMGMKLYHLAGELEDVLGKTVDLQTHRQIGDNANFIEKILTEGILIYDSRRRTNSSGLFTKADITDKT